ncbi:MAG: hypothetical protein JW927_16740 [Deltaproteobacteria bacterium]|nr:hypothetical protein [Deltaproteobacteria bacterium]
MVTPEPGLFFVVLILEFYTRYLLRRGLKHEVSTDLGKTSYLDIFSFFDNVEGVETFNRECDLVSLGSARLS